MRALVLLIAACGGSAVAPAAPITSGPASGPAPETESEAKPVEAAPVAPINSEEAKRASAEFLDLVRESAGALKGCYNSAQSANPELRTREIPLSITAEFDASGLVRLSLSPMVTEAFAECVKQRTAGWKVAVTQKMTFKASVTLKP